MSLHFYVVDVETTGLKTDWHEITQISIIRCSDRHQLNKYIRPTYPERTSPQALEATGRTLADLRQGISKEEAVEACEKFLLEDGATAEHRCMIAHNAPFDRRFCHSLWASLNKTFPAVCWMDTKNCTKEFATLKLGIEKPKLTLQASLEMLGIKPKTGFHNAVGDTQNTYLLREHLKKNGFDFLPHIKRTPHGEE